MAIVINGSGTITGLTAPAFAAYMSATTQSYSAATYTKVAFNTEYFDTNSNYDTTNYRFTPTTAGYYQVNVTISVSDNASGSVQTYAYLYKNGAAYALGRNYNQGQPLNNSFSCVVSMNGSTDYLEVYAYNSGGSPIIQSGGINGNQFSASFVRSA